MKHWTPGRLQVLGYLLGTLAATLVAVVATKRPRIGLALLIAAVVLVVVGAVMIGMAQRGGRA
jgi:hypothetical protein